MDRVLSRVKQVIVRSDICEYEDLLHTSIIKDIEEAIDCDDIIANRVLGPTWTQDVYSYADPVGDAINVLLPQIVREIGDIDWEQVVSQSTRLDSSSEDEEIDDAPSLSSYGGEGLSSETISKYLRTRVCGSKGILDGDKVCAICCDRFCRKRKRKTKKKTRIGVLKCGHEYHVKCIKEWLLKKNICPLCRAQGLEPA